MTVIGNPAGTFDVVEGHRIIESDFPTMAAAWRWIDRHEGDPISLAEKRSAWIASKILGGRA